MNYQRSRALIDLRAVRHNAARVSQAAAGKKIMAVVKSNAYGHGALNIAGALAAQVDAFAVATIEEGIELRQAQITLPIVVLSAFWCAAQIDHCRAYSLTPVIHNLEQIQWLEAADQRPQAVWLKINSGMNRVGIELDQVCVAVARLEALAGVEIAGLMTHLANADNLNDSTTKRQLECFVAATKDFDYPRSMANSAAIVGWPETHFDWVRPGIMLYGASPIVDQTAAAVQLKPVMQLESRLLSNRSLKPGSAVGYGGIWRNRDPVKLGIAAIGYGDGYPRMIDRQAHAMVLGTRCQIVGRVSMDSLALDLTDCDEAALGAVVTLWGQEPTVDEVAAWAGTISYELLCRITARVPRLVVEHG